MPKKKIKILILICVIVLIAVLAPIRLKDKYNNFMAEPNWGLLEKSQVDDETIEEAIDRLIAAHNDDADAHIGAGKSLNTHKTQETVDHPADSIVEDKIPTGEMPQRKLSNTEISVFTAFESLDGFNKSGAGITQKLLGVTLNTGAVINTQRYINNEPTGIGDINTYDKDTFFQTAIKLAQITDQEILFMTGDFQDDDSDEGFGFKIEDGTLYAIVVKKVVGARTEYKTEITGITLTNLNVYSAFFDVSESKIYFYVNGVLKHTESTNLPDQNNPVMFVYSIENTAAASKYMGIAYLFYSREI